MKKTVRIINKTPWRSDHLRAFVMKVRDEVWLPQDRKALEVTFVSKAVRLGVSGRASIHGMRSLIRVPGPAFCGPGAKVANLELKMQVASVLRHELAHNAGANGERWMRRSNWLGWGPGWRNTVTWAQDLPLELKPVKEKQTKEEKLDAEVSRLQRRLEQWQRRLRRASRAVDKISRAIDRKQLKLAIAASKTEASE